MRDLVAGARLRARRRAARAAALAGVLLLSGQVHWSSQARAASLLTTSTAVASSPNPSSYGTTVTFTATVSTGAGNPTGTIQFFDGASTLGIAGLDGGMAQLTTPFLGQGDHTISATYSGDATFAASTSPPLVHTVAASTNGPTSTSIISSQNPSNRGAAVTFTVTIFSPLPGTPGGTVTFLDGGAPMGSVALVDRRAEFTNASLSVGNHSITAVYGGDGTYIGSVSQVLNQVVVSPPRVRSSTTVVSSLNPSTAGAAITFTATVSGSRGIPTGTVTFFDSGARIGDAALDGGRGSVLVQDLTVGGHSIVARFWGDDRFEESSSLELLQIVKAPVRSASLTVVSSSRNPSVVGESVAFTVLVTSESGTPAGSVQLVDGAALLAALDLDVGRAVWTTSALVEGRHSISATYAGDSAHLGSTSAPLAQVVQGVPGAATTVTLAASANQSTTGQAVTFTATVSSSSGTPTGSVEFYDGETLLGMASLAGGQAQFTTSSLHSGNRLIRAAYTGGTGFAGASSPTLLHNVLLGDTRPVLSSSANPSVRGQPVTFQASMDPSCEGTVTFLDGSNWVGTALPEQGGRYRLSLSNLTVGTHRMVAVYTGGAICPAGTSSVLEQVVQPAGTSTSITVAAAPSGASGAFILTASTRVLPPGTGTLTGAVVFRDGERLLGTSNLNQAGVATLAATLNPSAPHAIEAQYIGSAEFAASTSVRLSDLTDLAKPDFDAAFVVNSASFAPGLSPSAFATIFGSRLSGGVTAVSTLPYPNAVQGVRVTLNGSPARLVYVSDQQINLVVPSDTAVGTASVVVTTALGSSNSVSVPVAAASPGIFADSASGYGAILVAGGAETTLTRPVHPGEYIEIYGTGLGVVDASGRTVLPVTVNLGSLRLTPAYSGLNPVYPGLYQINVQIPQGLTGEQKVSIESNQRRSNEVKIRIQ